MATEFRDLFTDQILEDFDKEQAAIAPLEDYTMKTTTYREPWQAFEGAITSGRLSNNRSAENFAGGYMYMGTVDGADTFKHIDSRRYLAPIAAGACLALAPAVSFAHLEHDVHVHTVDELGLFVVVAIVAAFAWAPAALDAIKAIRDRAKRKARR